MKCSWITSAGRRGLTLVLFATLGVGHVIVAAAAPLFKAPAMVFDIGQDPADTASPYGDQRTGATADLNGDRHDDVVVANPNSSAGLFNSGNTVSVLLANTAPGSPELFLPKTNYAVGLAPAMVTLIDVNNDLNLDVVTYNEGDSTATVLLGNGAGQFGSRTDTYVGYGSLIVGDTNNDGKADLIRSTQGGDTRVYFGQGAGTFLPGPISSVGMTARHLGDFNGDGKTDMIGVNGGTALLQFSSGNGDGTFNGATTVFESLTGNRATTVGDFDLDMIPDLALAYAEGGTQVRVLHGVGNGTFTPNPAFSLPDIEPWEMAAGDMDLDGALDVIITINEALTTTVGEAVNSVQVVYGDGAGGFLFSVATDGGGNLGKPLIGDFDGDGFRDIASPNFLDYVADANGEHALSVLLSSFGTQFGGGYHLQVTHDPVQESIADVDRDGKTDLIVSAGQAQFDVYRGNGEGGYFPPIVVPTTPANAPGSFAVGDINRDGKLDLVSTSANLLLGVGDGTFTAGAARNYSGRVSSKSLVDLNRDGILDLVTLLSGGFSVYLGNVTGGFTSSYGVGIPSVREMAVADWNRDGSPDAAFATQGGVCVPRNDGAGFLGSVAILESSRRFNDVAFGDFNRDGLLDIAAREEYAIGLTFPDAGGISVFYGTGNSITPFGPRVAYPSFDRNGHAIESWDVNRDGFLDLVASSSQLVDGTFNDTKFWTVGVWLGNSTGFVRDSDFLTGVGLIKPSMAVGDINRDGQPDILGHNSDILNDYSTRVDYLTFLRGNEPWFPQGLTHFVDIAPWVRPMATAAGDLNQDGIADLVALWFPGSGAVSKVTTRLGLGNGMFGASLTDSAPPIATDLALGDMNRDGKLDVVIVGFDRIDVALGTGTGELGARTTLLPPINSPGFAGMAIGDVNRDGKLDIIASQGSNYTAGIVHMGNGDGTFQPAVLFTNSMAGARNLTLADINRDGVLDLVSSDGTPNGIGISFGDGVSFLPGSLYTHGRSRDVALGDLNRDGVMDVAAADSGRIYVQLGNLGGGLGPATDYSLNSSGFAQSIAIADLDGSGHLDVIAACGSGASSRVAVWYGNGFGGLGPRNDFVSPSQPISLALSDVNRDGKTDVAAACRGTDQVAIFLNGSFTPSAVEVEPASAPAAALGQNSPNPFNPRTTIRFSLAQGGRVRLRVFDVHGHRVATLVDGAMPAGEHSVEWRGRDDRGRESASGVYFYRIEAGAFIESRRMILMK